MSHGGMGDVHLMLHLISIASSEVELMPRLSLCTILFKWCNFKYGIACATTYFVLHHINAI